MLPLIDGVNGRKRTRCPDMTRHDTKLNTNNINAGVFHQNLYDTASWQCCFSVACCVCVCCLLP